MNVGSEQLSIAMVGGSGHVIRNGFISVSTLPTYVMNPDKALRAPDVVLIQLLEAPIRVSGTLNSW